MPKNPHADFTPALEGYSGQGKFRFWCQMALPLTYDDSLSYYELLCKVVNYLNHTIEDVANAETNVGRLAEAYTQLQNYVNKYFDDIDIEAELRNVLDAMAEDGTLDDLLDPLVQDHLPGVVDEQIDAVVEDQIGDAVASQIDAVVAEQLPPLVEEGIPGEVSDWLTENVDPVGSAVVVDSSLTISGAAADAKVTGDELTDLKTQIKDAFGFADNIKFVSFTKGAYINCVPSGTTVVDLTPIPTATVSYAIIECSEREPIVLNGKGYYNGRLWCFIDSDNNRLSAASTSVEANNLVIRAPKNAAKCIINVQNSTMGPCFYGGFLEDKENISAIERTLGLNNIENPIETNIKYLTESTTRGITFTPKTWNTIHVQGTTDASYNATYQIFDNKSVLPGWIEKGKRYKIKLRAENEYINLNVYYYDSLENLTSIVNMGNPVLNASFALPDNAVGMRITLLGVMGTHAINEDVSIFITSGKTATELTAESSRNNIKELFAGNAMVDINHRGFSQQYPENTITAFEMSAAYGYKFIECDIQKCLDGYVILHDGTIDRTTSGTGNISEMTIAQIQTYPVDITAWSGLEPVIPTFEEALQCFSDGGLIPIIELKKETIEETDIPNIINILEKWGGKYILTSLEHGFRNNGQTHKKLLEAVRQYSEEIPINVLLWEECTNDIIDGIYNTFGINTAIQLNESTEPTKQIIEYAHKKGLSIGAYTPSTYQRYHELNELGFDFCTSNYLMNNHQIMCETSIEYVENSTFTDKRIDLTGVKGGFDVVWVRGYIKAPTNAYVQFTDQSYYKLKVESNGKFKYVNFQCWVRGSNPYITITSDNGTDNISTKLLSIQKMKCVFNSIS